MTIMTVENAESVLMDRLIAYHKEITGINRVYRYPPSIAPDLTDCPFVFHTMREMPSEIPKTSDSPGSAPMNRRIIAHFCREPFTAEAEDSGDLGMMSMNRLEPWFGKFRGAYLRRGSLRIQGGIHPDVPDPLPALNLYDLTFRDSGMITRPVSGTIYLGIDWFLNVPLDLFRS